MPYYLAYSLLEEKLQFSKKNILRAWFLLYWGGGGGGSAKYTGIVDIVVLGDMVLP